MPNQKIVAELINWHFPEPIPLRTSNLRAPGDIARCFASESLIDEIAADLKVDPVEFRLNNLTGNKRAIECLQAAAAKAGWQKRPSPAPAVSGNIAKGRGVAITQRAKTYVATVAEVEVNKTSGQVAVKRIVCSHDCGLMINPDGVKNQVEGNVIQGVSRALFEEVTFDSSGAVTSLDWATYPILRFPDLPELEVVLINRPEVAPLGAGEGATIPPAAAIANHLRRCRRAVKSGRVYTETRGGGNAEKGVIRIGDWLLFVKQKVAVCFVKRRAFCLVANLTV